MQSPHDCNGQNRTVLTFPDVFPGGWDRLPIEVRRFLTARVLEKQLAIQDGASGIIEWLYRGEERESFKGSPAARASGVVRYNATAAELWSIVLQDTLAWQVARAARPAGTMLP